MTEMNNNQTHEMTIEQELEAAHTTTGLVSTMVNTLNQTLEERLAGGAVE